MSSDHMHFYYETAIMNLFKSCLFIKLFRPTLFLTSSKEEMIFKSMSISAGGSCVPILYFSEKFYLPCNSGQEQCCLSPWLKQDAIAATTVHRFPAVQVPSTRSATEEASNPACSGEE